jgi:hypothetical protein
MALVDEMAGPQRNVVYNLPREAFATVIYATNMHLRPQHASTLF